MTVAVKEDTKMEEEVSLSINDINPSKYGCQVLQEKTTLERANDKTLPNDARLIWYTVDGKEYIDLTRCKKTSSAGIIIIFNILDAIGWRKQSLQYCIGRI